MTQGLTGAICDSNYNYQQPATGFSITLSNTDWHVILDPAGTLATGTITMPPNPLQGQIVNIRSSQIITTLTISPNSGQGVVGAPTTLGVGGSTEGIYRLNNGNWYF